jgi:hypothetical protein
MLVFGAAAVSAHLLQRKVTAGWGDGKARF